MFSGAVIQMQKMLKRYEKYIPTDYQIYLFKEGTNYKSYGMFGAIKIEHAENAVKRNLFRFAVYAPNADAVSVVGDFNSWDPQANPMVNISNSGVWCTFVDGINEGEKYKYCISAKDGKKFLKSDPFGFFHEVRPATASIVWDLKKYQWNDGLWVKNRCRPYNKPVLIYEIHAGSWKRHSDGTFLNYRELADMLIPYVKEMGYNYIELLPIMEHPYDGSWGYQVTGYFSPTSRYGCPEDFMYFVDMCHVNNIGVILDWVPAHFPRDAHGLARFDGTCLFEYADPKEGEHKEWGTLVFNYARPEVVSFLMSSAFFWFDVYHIDGLRVDAVSSMLYRNYGRKDGEWIPNCYGGCENLEAVDFLKKLNKSVFSNFENVFMIAEESTAWPKVTGPVHEGGLGFNFKWNMGWMNDTLKYMSMDPYFRKGNHNLLTFPLVYAFSENFILPLSHDEVVHGKKSLIDKMHGDYMEKFSSLRAYLAYMMCMPGKKLLFMGIDFAHFAEWDFKKELDWCLLGYEMHYKFKHFCSFLNKLYIKDKCLWQKDDSWEGFEWINEKDSEKSVISFIRRGASSKDFIIAVCNFTPVERKTYEIKVPEKGKYTEVLNTQSSEFGGWIDLQCNYQTKGKYIKNNDNKRKMQYFIELDLPPLSTVIIKKHTKQYT